jgi:hypothetical protein
MAHQCSACNYETDVGLELREHWNEVHQTMTRDAVLRLANAAADRVIAGLDSGNRREVDISNLMVNMLGTMLDHPDATLDDAMDANYGGGADEVRSWWPGWGRPSEADRGHSAQDSSSAQT